MHPEIEKLIEMAIADGIVTNKEREIILRKAEKLGLDIDEVEMYLEGKLSSFSIDFQSKNEKSKNKLKNDIPPKDKPNSFVETEDLLEWYKILENINNKYKEYLDVDVTSNLFENWINNDLEKLVDNEDSFFSRSLGAGVLNDVLSILNTAENHFNIFIQDILKNEKILGYFFTPENYTLGFLPNNNPDDYDKNSPYKFYLQKLNRFEYKNYDSWILTNRNMYKFSRRQKTIIKKKMFFQVEEEIFEFSQPFRISYKEIKDPMDYFSKNKENNPIIKFRNLFSEFYESKLNLYDEINNISLKFTDTYFCQFIDTSYLKENEIDNLLKINNYIKREISDFNNFIYSIKPKIIDNNGYIFYLSPKCLKINTFNSFDYNSYCENILNLIINSIKFLSKVIKNRDLLLSLYLNNDIVKSKELYLNLEENAIFLNKFERLAISKIDEINNNLKSINHSIIEGFNSLENSLEELNSGVKESNEILSGVKSGIEGIGLLNLISTYQLYKINKQTKS